MLAGYREELPLLPGAVEAVERMAARWPLGLASSSNPEAIELVLELSGLRRHFAVAVSSEEVARGKPAPDVYLEAARRLDVDARECVAVEDSENGIRSANAAGMRVIAVPNAEFPPAEEAVALADRVLGSLAELTPDLVEGSTARPRRAGALPFGCRGAGRSERRGSGGSRPPRPRR